MYWITFLVKLVCMGATLSFTLDPLQRHVATQIKFECLPLPIYDLCKWEANRVIHMNDTALFAINIILIAAEEIILNL